MEGALSIPGYGGYLAKRRYDQESQAAELGQLIRLGQVSGQLQEQEDSQKIRGALSSAKTPAEAVSSLVQLGTPKSLELATHFKGLLAKPTQIVPAGATVTDSEGNALYTSPPKPSAETESPLAKLLRERDALPPNHPSRSVYDAAIAKSSKASPEENAGLSQQYATDGTYRKNVDYWANLLSQGGTLPPRFAQSGAGKKMLPDILNVVPTLGKGDSKDMIANQVDLTGQKSEARAVGTRSAQTEMAAGEARDMMPVLLATSEAFKRTGYQPINKVIKDFQDKTGSVESRQFGAALNTFVNVYARAVSPSGTPTVSDKDHAREVLSTADSHEQLMGLLKVLDQEMTAAQNAPGRVRAAQRAGITGTPAGHGGAPNISAAVTKAGWSYEPDKYDYRISPTGEVQRKAK